MNYQRIAYSKYQGIQSGFGRTLSEILSIFVLLAMRSTLLLAAGFQVCYGDDVDEEKR